MSQAVHQERLMTVLQGPLLTEKGAMAAELHNQVVFKVRTDATKAEIRNDARSPQRLEKGLRKAC